MPPCAVLFAIAWHPNSAAASSKPNTRAIPRIGQKLPLTTTPPGAMPTVVVRNQACSCFGPERVAEGDRENSGPERVAEGDRENSGPERVAEGDRENSGPERVAEGDRENSGPERVAEGDRESL